MGAGVGIYLGSGVLLGVVCALIAVGKGHPPWVGFLLGFVFSVGGLIAVIVMGSSAKVHGIPPPHPGSRWLSDPVGRHQYRLWDGQQWTGHVSDGGRSGFDPLG